ncbi:hypothetical protein ACJX0J_036630, partial [Zea mays]
KLQIAGVKQRLQRINLNKKVYSNHMITILMLFSYLKIFTLRQLNIGIYNRQLNIILFVGAKRFFWNFLLFEKWLTLFLFDCISCQYLNFVDISVYWDDLYGGNGITIIVEVYKLESLLSHVDSIQDCHSYTDFPHYGISYRDENEPAKLFWFHTAAIAARNNGIPNNKRYPSISAHIMGDDLIINIDGEGHFDDNQWLFIGEVCI